MKDYSAKQIANWEKSLITVYSPDGYRECTRELGEAALISLFTEGFSLKGKIQDDGTQRVMTAAGREIVIHSKSLGRALRKRAKQHKWSRSRYLKEARWEMAKLCGQDKNGLQFLAVQCASIGINADPNSAAEDYFLMLPGHTHQFRRETWNAPLVYFGRTI